jgi:hypothetical protein
MGKSRGIAAAILAAGMGFVVVPSFADDTKVPAADTKSEGAFTKWLFSICAKDFKALTGSELPADAKDNAKKAFEEFKKKKVAQEGGDAPKGAILFYEDRLAVSNGNGTAISVGGNGSLDFKTSLASLGKPLGWAKDALGGGGGAEKAAPAATGAVAAGNATGGATAKFEPPSNPVQFTTNMTKDERVKKMIEKANWITAQHYAYQWGGGHNAEFSGPYDCSGAVSAILHAGGCLSSPMVAQEFESYGAAGKGEVTIYAKDSHVIMSIDGKCFGTSSAYNPGGGAAWFTPDAGYWAAEGFTATRHVPLN